MGTKIEYCDETINPIRTKAGGWYCVKSSPGCNSCYAEKINLRFGDKKPYSKRDIELVLNERALEKPLKWKNPKRIFIQDMSDLFLDGTPYEYQYKTFKMVLRYPQHTFIMLTKHPENMEAHFRPLDKLPPNLWLGITAENQKMFDERWAVLKQIPAAAYMISYEPALGPLVLPPDFLALGKRAWLVVGGESGPGARPMHPNWARNVRDQCIEAGVPFFFKQFGEWRGFRVPKNILKGEAVYCEWRRNFIDPNIFPIGSEFNPDGYFFKRVGKKAAGRKLDGKIWNQFPEVAIGVQELMEVKKPSP